MTFWLVMLDDVEAHNEGQIRSHTYVEKFCKEFTEGHSYISACTTLLPGCFTATVLYYVACLPCLES